MNYKGYEPMNQATLRDGLMTGTLTTTMPPPERDKGEIDVQMQRLSDRLRDLQGALGVLEDRLSPLLTPQAKDANARPTESTATALGTYISSISQDLQYAVDRVHTIINRLGL